MSSVSASSSATSGTLGDAPPVSFPGVASGIDYNAIIEKYTAETLQQEAPLQTQVSNINNQNTAILKIKNLLGAVQDSLTALSNPTIFGAYKATPSNTANGSTAATFTQLTGQTAVAGTYTINAQTAATATVITNNSRANGALDTNDVLAAAGTAITPTNGTASNGSITINGVQVNYNVDTQSLSTILNNIAADVSGVGYTINANGTVSLTGVTSIGSGADSGNLEQVLKLDTAQLGQEGVNATSPIGSAGLATAPTSGTVVVNGQTVSYNTTTDSLDTILANINAATTSAIGTAIPTLTAGTIVVNGTAVAYTTGETLSQILQAIKTATGVDASISSGDVVTLGGGGGTALTSLADGGGGNLVESLNLTGAISGGYTTGTAAVAASAVGVTGTVSQTGVTLNNLTSLANGTGNLLQALNLTGAISGGSTSSTAPLTGNTGYLTSSSSINGINEDSALNSTNSAGFATQVTAGTFTINGVQFTVNPSTDSLSSLIAEINASSAGVVAQYNTSTSQITLTSSTAGPESILLGASSDTSNFLTAAGFLSPSTGTVSGPGGGTTIAGTQASLTYTQNGSTQTVYSATDTFNNVIPGFSLNVTSSSPSSYATPPYSTYYTVSVAADPSQAETAINAFIKAYNAAITELNNDLKSPTVTAGTTSSDGIATSSSSGGGVLYGNFEVEELKNQLVSQVSGFIPSGSSAYNSLSTIGITLNTASQTVGEQSDSSDSTDSSTSASTDSGLTVTGGTDGTLAALDTTTFEAAYAANTSAVQSLFTLIPPTTSNSSAYDASQYYGTSATANSGFAYQLGTLIANSNGLTTFLQNSAITPADLSNVLLSSIIDSNDQQIDSIDEQISTITTEANNQANQLRAQFTASESQIAELQALQQQIAAIGH